MAFQTCFQAPSLNQVAECSGDLVCSRKIWRYGLALTPPGEVGRVQEALRVSRLAHTGRGHES